MTLRVNETLKPGTDRKKINWARDFTSIHEEYAPHSGYTPQSAWGQYHAPVV